MAFELPYLTFSQDQTIQISISDLATDDGSPFPYVDYAIQYAAQCDEGGGRSDYGFWSGSRASVRLDQSNGVIVNAGSNIVTFDLGTGKVRPGLYRHSARALHIATGQIVPLFGGGFAVECGPFNGSST